MEDVLNKEAAINDPIARKREEHPIRFRKDFSYVRTVPTFVCNSVSGTSEIARWVLNRNQILHVEKPHAPGIYEKIVNRLTGNNGLENNPVLLNTDTLIYTAESIIQRFDQKIPAEKRLFPDDPEQRKRVEELFRQFTVDLERYVWQYVYSELFSSRKNAIKLFKNGVSRWEKFRYTIGYPFLKKSLIKKWEIKDKDSVVFLVEIKKIFEQVDDILKDGRKYLTGDRITAADLAFASVAAPVILPEEFGGSITKISEISEELRQEIIELRATKAGQFVLGIYQEDRTINMDLGPVPEKSGFFKKLLTRIIIKLTGKSWKIFSMLQKRFPVIRIGLAKIAIVSRHDLVVNVLDRDGDFTVKEINAKKMANQKGAFFLGMDRSDPQFNRERDFVRKSTHRDDLELIRSYVRKNADEICEQMAPYGKIDVVQSFNYVILIGLMGHYFGVPAPVASQMERWQRTMFYDLFLNLNDNEEKHQMAVDSGKERTAWVRELIASRKRDLRNGKEIGDNLLNRLIKLQQEPEYSWVDDDTIRRNIGGLLTGIQETTSKAVIFVLQELFKRPKDLKGAIKASQERDMDKVKGYVYEALRFNPVQPGMFRFSETKQILKGSGKKTYTIKGNRKVLALTSGAMFDPVTFPNPKTFNPERDALYMNWGFALHECYGKYINAVTIPEMVAAVLRLKNVRPAKGALGRGAGLKEGPFPNNYV
ncbi:MAG: cytochrome P450, partial [Flavobacteriales bacterium]|nr:cytochrome P450 [Flavobacteriales bacterium]